MKPKKDDNAVIEEVLAGNKDAFAYLVDKYKDRLFSMVLNIVKQNGIAEEVSQTAFIKAYENLARFKKKSELSTWLYRIAYNESISSIRAKKKKEVGLDDFEHKIAEKPAGDNAQDKEYRLNLLNELVNRLKERDYTIVYLYYYENMSMEEIAGVTGLSVSNAKVRLHRIRKKLYTEMNKTIDSNGKF